MTVRGSLFHAATATGQPPNSVFGVRPQVERLVKEVVSFPPAPDPYRAVERASQRIAQGKSLFVDSHFDEHAANAQR